MKRWLVILLATTATVTVACSSDDPDRTQPTGTQPTATQPTGSADVEVPELRAELLAMMEEDQAEQTGEVQTNDYTARTERLGEILDEYGWPTIDLVGEDGSTAAWVIAQHADLDPELQQRALELLRPAAESGQASLGDLAYLEDRVAVAAGMEQSYGTQMGCAEDGTPRPRTPIADESNVEERRTEAGLAPLADYVEEMTAICAGVE